MVPQKAFQQGTIISCSASRALTGRKTSGSCQIKTTFNFSGFCTFPMKGLGPLLKKKIHVAEDDPDILFALSSIVEDAGYHVRIRVVRRSSKETCAL
jgi:hypothetical protein